MGTYLAICKTCSDPISLPILFLLDSQLFLSEIAVL